MPPKIDAAIPDKITLADVALHNNKDDCWLAIDGAVYNATEFLPEHPGGALLATWAGQDATDVFGAFHPDDAQAMLASYYVGPLHGSKPSSAASEFRALKAKLMREGMFNASASYYTFKVAFNMAMLALSVWLVAHFRGYLGATLGALSIAMFWQQCGWLSHDFLHHQVFANRKYGDMMGLFLGNVMQGFSLSWWKDKHNTHHSIPNVMEGVREGDPDINTMPFLAWSDAFLEGEPLAGMPAVMIKYQKVLFLPLLCIARTSWVLQSLLFVAFKPVAPRLRKLEAVTLALHYAYMIAIMASFLTVPEAIFFFFLSQAAGGLLLGVIFTINHNSMAVLPNDTLTTTDFSTLQLLTTRNITSSIFMDWFTGGLNYQIEHHLFPQLPRHRFHLVAPRVQEICARHGLPYTCIGFVDGVADVIRHLGRVSETMK